jgi:hypothetical protein
VSCAFIARAESGERVWPLRRPDPGEPISEYLFCQRGLRGGEGMLLPSTLLIPAALHHRIPRTAGLARYDDTDWLLRAVQVPGTAVLFPTRDEPQAIWHQEERRATMSRGAGWRTGLRFAQERRHLFTPRSYASFLLTSVNQTAAADRQPGAIPVLLREAVRAGRPSLIDGVAFASMWLVPRAWRTRLTSTRRHSASADRTGAAGASPAL